jgi:hypothetical protein
MYSLSKTASPAQEARWRGRQIASCAVPEICPVVTGAAVYSRRTPFLVSFESFPLFRLLLFPLFSNYPRIHKHFVLSSRRYSPAPFYYPKLKLGLELYILSFLAPSSVRKLLNDPSLLPSHSLFSYILCDRIPLQKEQCP